MDQNNESVIFAVNKDEGTITAIFGAGYTGDAQDFAWILPLSAAPTAVENVDPETLTILPEATQKQFTEPTNTCQDLLTFNGAVDFFDEPPGDGLAQLTDYTVISNQKPGELERWIQANNFQMTDDMRPVIQQYVDSGMVFLALRLHQDSDGGKIKPVRITYKADKPILPIRLSSSVDTALPLDVWIFADTQYAPENYAHPAVDYSQMREPSQISASLNFNYGAFYPFGLYTDVRDNALDAQNGQAFVTEYAQPTSALSDKLYDPNPVIQKLAAQYPYVTELVGYVLPTSMTPDPAFVPAPNAAAVSDSVDLNDYVDRLDYWGCSSITQRNPQAEALLPEHTWIDKLGFDVAHPAGWVLSQFTVGEKTMWAVAPKAVDADTLNAYFAGEAAPPMLLARSYNGYGEGFCTDYCSSDFLADAFWQSIGQSSDSLPPDAPQPSIRLRDKLYGEISADGVLYTLLASASDWEQNKPVFDAMLSYPATYQRYAHPDLPNTLFLNLDVPDQDNREGVYIGYPDGWNAHWNKQEDIAVLSPVGADQSSVYAHLLPMEQFRAPDDTSYYPGKATIDNLAKRYDLDASDIEAIHQHYDPAGDTICVFDVPAVPFKADGRQGYIAFIRAFVVEVSAPEAEFARYDTDMHAIADSLSDPSFGSCG